MVLNKSKWDHKAKIQYLRKHNLSQPKRQEEPRRKWSAKRSSAPDENLWLRQIRSGDDDDEWTETDDVILNHFYPNISEDNLPLQEKKNLKTQILATIRGQLERPLEEPLEDHADGIYLGTRPVEVPPEPLGEEPEQLDIADLETKLGEFIVSDFGLQKPRELLKHQTSENLLEEYGMSDYRSTVKAHDYNTVSEKRTVNLDHYNADDLHGFKIGLSLHDLNPRPAPPSARELSEAEMKEHVERSKKNLDARFRDLIKRKFGGSAPKSPAYLEINNFNSNDAKQMSALNAKLSQVRHTDPVSAQDLDDLLGYTAQDVPPETPASNPLDLLEQLDSIQINSASKKDSTELREPASAAKPEPRALSAGRNDEGFLDNLLG